MLYIELHLTPNIQQDDFHRFYILILLILNIMIKNLYFKLCNAVSRTKGNGRLISTTIKAVKFKLKKIQ